VRLPVLPIAAICLVVVLVAVGSALLFGSLGATTYGARAEILYDAPASAPLEARDRGLTTQRALILSRAVLAPVAREQGMSLAAVEKAVSVDLGTRNDLLYITAGLTDRAAALDVARAVTASYLRLDARVMADARESREALQHELATLTASEHAAQGPAAAVLQERVRRLSDRIVQVDADTADRPTPRVLSSAYPLDRPLSPRPARLVAAGLIVGLAIAAAVALLLSRLPPPRSARARGSP
jgi:capsular polysaccharide biosynthesis protein